MSLFKKYVIDIVKKIPYGTVVSYGQVALYAGAPRAARQVGWILNQTEGNTGIPWWRVINNAGRITIKGTKYNGANLQRKLLMSEGIEVDSHFNLDINKYRFIADEVFFKNLNHDEKYLDLINEKIPFSDSPRLKN